MTPQVRTLIKHFAIKHSITNVEAQNVYRIRSLPRRITDLKEIGFTFRREFKKDMTGQRYVRYSVEHVPAPYKYIA